MKYDTYLSASSSDISAGLLLIFSQYLGFHILVWMNLR